jgi:hypothetical protein
MERVIKILIQYEQADFAQRIHLFLQYPGMRDAFVEIEHKGCCCQKGLSICGGTIE